jgi:hypothetical protein
MPRKPATIEQARVTVSLPEVVWSYVEQYAEENGLSKTDALRRAISLFRRAAEASRNGQRLIIENPDGSDRREILFD